MLLSEEEVTMTVYVITQGSRIIREGRHLLVKLGDATYHTLFTYRLSQLVLAGNIAVTPPAMKLLLREGIDTVFLRLDGRYQGRLALVEPKNVFLRKRQFLLTDDEKFCLSVSKRMLSGKLLNMLTVVQRIQRTRSGVMSGDPVGEIRRMANRIETAKSLDELRGLEGQAATSYFPALRFGLTDSMGFEKRVRRPPTDPVNSVLSLLYTFIINRAYAAVRIAGLDPYPGVLHSLDYGRFSLPLDLVEEFRPIIADTLTLSLFNLGVLKQDDFYTFTPPQLEEIDRSDDIIDTAVNDGIGRMNLSQDEDAFDMPSQRMEEDYHVDEALTGKPSVKLHSDAFGKVVKAFEKKIGTEFYHPVAEKKMTYGEAMTFQARLYRKVVEGEAAEYHPLLLK